jgi:hypothetical protein
VWDFESPLAEAIAALFPTAIVVRGMFSLRMDEWDVLVSRNGTGSLQPSRLFIISFGNGIIGASQAQLLGMVGPGTVATEFEVPDNLDPRVLRLVHSDLLPVVQHRSPNPYISPLNAYGAAYNTELTHVLPFLRTTEPRTLAGEFLRLEGQTRAWALPDGVDVVAWTSCALSIWRSVDPERFPSGPDWRHDATWQTPEERSWIAEIEAAATERDALVLALDQRAQAAEMALSAAREAADQAERQLITAQGPELVNAVIAALRAFGLTVHDMDEIWPDNDKREDLRVATPDDPDWEALVEVRGYTSGAKVSDLLRIQGRFVPRYIVEKGKSPTSSWYIANQFLKEDPVTRPPILQTNPEEVREFGTASGLCIDTRDLLRLWLGVQSGKVAPVDVRRLLTSSRGRLAVS